MTMSTLKGPLLPPLPALLNNVSVYNKKDWKLRILNDRYQEDIQLNIPCFEHTNHVSDVSLIISRLWVQLFHLLLLWLCIRSLALPLTWQRVKNRKQVTKHFFHAWHSGIIWHVPSVHFKPHYWKKLHLLFTMLWNWWQIHKYDGFLK